MEQTTTTSTKGKGLGVAGMIIGIVAFIWAVIPILGAGALWIAAIGLILSVIAIFMARSGKNPKKGMIITGVILNVLALSASAYWLYTIASAASMMMDGALESGMMNSIQ